MGVIFVEKIVFVAEMANLQIVMFDIIIKEVISSNSGLVLTQYFSTFVHKTCILVLIFVTLKKRL